MDKLEQTLVDIESQMTDAITKQQLTVARTIYDVAGDSITAARTLDEEFSAVFPELAKFEPDVESDSPSTPLIITPKPKKEKKAKIVTPQELQKIEPKNIINHNTSTQQPNIFNPKFIIDIRDGKGVSMPAAWDKTEGFLPGRKVICKYYIDVGSKKDVFIYQPGSYMYCNLHKKAIESTNYKSFNSCYASQITINCECQNFYNNMSQHMYGVVQVNQSEIKSIARNEHRELFEANITHEFEVDNYLNLYHPDSGLYICFNKTAFPAFPFLARPQVFQSKRIINDNPMTFKFDASWLSSVDARPQILEAVQELIPDNYYDVIDFYDRFRKLSGYRNGLKSSSEGKESPGAETDILDPESMPPPGHQDTRDKLIRELETRLAKCLKQIDLTDSYNQELSELYRQQSEEVLALTRQVNEFQANKKLMDTTARVEENRQIFALKRQLADLQGVIARSEIQGQELARLETELGQANLDVDKYKGLCQGLTAELLDAKRVLKQKSDEHAAGILNINRQSVKYTDLSSENAKLQRELTGKQHKISGLELQLLTAATNKPDKGALEQVLTTQYEEQQREKTELVRKISELQKENLELKKEYDAFRAKLTGLMTGCGTK